MQQPATAVPSPSAASFAGLLAALTAPKPGGVPDWNNDGLEDDVATLSYEHALRAHARYRPGNSADRSLTQPAGPALTDTPQPYLAHAAQDAPAATAQANALLGAQTRPLATQAPATAIEGTLKSASITIRLSKAECAQLRRRAAEAGLTVSAYLRSCTFEAESLRAMVKETLARFQPEPSKANPPAPASVRHSRLGRLLRFLSGRNPSQRIARA